MMDHGSKFKVGHYPTLPPILTSRGFCVYYRRFENVLNSRGENGDQENCGYSGFGDARGDDGIRGRRASRIRRDQGRLRRRDGRTEQRQEGQGSREGPVDLDVERLSMQEARGGGGQGWDQGD